MSLSYLDGLWAALAVVLYGIATALLFRDLPRSDGRATRQLVLLLLLAAACHAFTLSTALFGAGGVNLNLGTALSLAAWVVVVLFLLALITQPLATLGLIVAPYAMLDVLIAWFLPGPPMQLAHLGGNAIVHTLMAIVAYGLLALAFCQASLLLLQEWQLHQRRTGTFFHALPPLETMERVLFQLIGTGFALLTVALISGGLFSTELFGRAFQFNHHVVLSFLAWLAFGALLGGRLIAGWRGRTAALWTIGSFGLLALAYFGTRLMLEVFLVRG